MANKSFNTCRNDNTYRCADCENKSEWEQSQVYGDAVSKANVLETYAELSGKLKGLEEK